MVAGNELRAELTIATDNRRKDMSKPAASSLEQGTRVLSDGELDFVSGGTEGYPGLPLGTKINVSPWGMTTPFDLQWALVGATGHL
jgi:hypothetical protein